MHKPRVLVLDDEANIGLSLRLILEREGYRVDVVRNLAEFRAKGGSFNLLLADVRLPDGSGIEALRETRQAYPEAMVIMISGQATIADAVEATRAGAFDFLEKPLARDRVLVAVKNATEQGRLRVENSRLREQAGGARMVGESAVWRRAVEEARLAARSDARVLLRGESGTGKEMLAALIHEASPFSGGPFVKVNCAAIPAELLESELFGHEKGSFTGAATMRRGKFELADGGSLFLDEVGDLPLAAQAKLLRVLQEGEFHRVGGEAVIRVSVRVVSATNRDLTAMAGSGAFREDLYYRLNVMPIRVPPLRERRDDIGRLAAHFLADFCSRNNFRAKSLGADLVGVLEGYSWPGNVRELRNTVERMAILTQDDLLDASAAPPELLRESTPASLGQARQGGERDHVLRTLEANAWNVSQAARALGMDRTNLHKRMRVLGIKRAG